MPYSDGDFRWWDLDNPRLFGSVYSILAPIQLGTQDYRGDWEVFERENPRGAYAWLVGGRCTWLEDAIVALRPIQKLLAAPDIPVRTKRGDINRDEWLKLSLDVFLFRIAGIRDHCLHLVSEVFELGLPPLEVRMSSVLPRLPDGSSEVRSSLQRIASIGVSHRKERNRRAHEGAQRSVIEEPWFKMCAMQEEIGDPSSGRVRVHSRVGDGEIYDVREVFIDAANRLDAEFMPACEELISAVAALVDALANPFHERAFAKATDETADLK